jgi:DNA primase
MLATDAVESVAEVLRLQERAAQRYAHALTSDSRAKRYLAHRAISPAAAKRFGLGFARPCWRNLRGIVEEFAGVDVVGSGLVIAREEDLPGTRYDRFRDRLMFPIRNLAGTIVGFGGRRLSDTAGDQAGEAPKYLNSPESCVFAKGTMLYGLYEAREAIAARGMALVVEGYIDVVSTAQAGFEAVVGTLGTACTPEHLAVLFSLTAHVVFCFDGDAAGRRAAARALQVALPWLGEGRTVSFVFLPADHDPDSYVRAFGVQALEAAIARATSPFELIVDQAQQGCNLTWPEDRARAAHFAGTCWARLSAGALADSLLRYSAALLKFSVAELYSLWITTHGHDGR